MINRSDPFHEALSLRCTMDQLFEQRVVPNVMSMMPVAPSEPAPGSDTTTSPIDTAAKSGSGAPANPTTWHMQKIAAKR